MFLVLSKLFKKPLQVNKFGKFSVCFWTSAVLSGSMAFLYSGRCNSQARLDGKIAVITGCNTGIGKVNALDFAKRGCKVIMACRDISRAEKAAEEIKTSLSQDSNSGQLVVVQLDLASLDSVRKCAQRILESEERIDILVNNAGVMMCPKTETCDGFELQMATNHLGHFLLTLLLLPRLLKTKRARIVNVSSSGHKKGVNDFEDINWKNTPYNAFQAYCQSKLANVHFTTELARRLKGTDVKVYAVHPGWVRTDLGRHLDSLYFPGMRFIVSLVIGSFMKSPEQGAQTQIYCSVDEKAGEESGLYYRDCRAIEPHAVAKDEKAAARLWEISAQMVGDFGDPFNAR